MHMGRGSCSSEASLHSLGPRSWGAPECSSLLSPGDTGGSEPSQASTAPLGCPLLTAPAQAGDRTPEPAQGQERTEELMGSLGVPSLAISSLIMEGMQLLGASSLP